MMTIDYLAVAAASVAGMAIGALWFSRILLGRQWAGLAGVDLKAKTPWWTYLLALVATVVSAWVLALAASVAHHALGGSFLGVTVAVAIVGWLGFTAARAAVEYLFEQRHVPLYAIDMGHQLAVLGVMGIVIGLFGN